MQILVVDDDAVSLRLLVALVERLGHQAVTASDGDAAWQSFVSGGCRVVISDWTMPGMEGIDLLRRIRARNDIAYTYFIMLTARSDRADHTAGMAAGADDFLVKPVRRDELAIRLRVAERIVGLQEELARRLRELSAANERMQRDIAAAVKVQEALLPTVLPVVPGLACAWRFNPCEQLGGDTLNLFRLDEQHLGFFILDVSGHGVPSALLAVQVSRFLSPLIMPGALLKTAQAAAPGYRLTPPLEVLRQLNGLFPMQGGNLQYFTIILGHYHLPSHRVTLVSAGHPGPVLVRRGGRVEIPVVAGDPVGFYPTETAVFAELEVRLEPGDRIYLYSDGVVETDDGQGALLGTARIGAALSTAMDATLEASLDALGTLQASWRQQRPASDDVTILAMEREL